MSLPRGFLAMSGCGDQLFPAMIAATFVPDPGSAIEAMNRYPKYTYYGGPLRSFIDAVQADAALWHWCRRAGWDYSSRIYCLYPEYQAGPYPHHNFQWHTEWETRPTETYSRVWNPQQGRYVFVVS